MSEADLQRVLQAADRMYDAIRQLFDIWPEKTADAYRELRKSADAYDTASEHAGPSPLVNTEADE
jgi:hypothetical protein